MCDACRSSRTVRTNNQKSITRLYRIIKIIIYVFVMQRRVRDWQGTLYGFKIIRTIIRAQI